jgi:transcriptional regulator
MKSRYENRIELLQGTLDLLILQTLQWEARHGYGISQAIRAGSGDVLQVDAGSLYPALHKLEARSLIIAEWGASENNRRAKFYRLTTAGKNDSTKIGRPGIGFPARSISSCATLDHTGPSKRGQECCAD